MTIEEKWQDYCNKVIPAKAPQVQFKECRRAFMAGAMSAIETVLENDMHVSIEELQLFKERVRLGLQ